MVTWLPPVTYTRLRQNLRRNWNRNGTSGGHPTHGRAGRTSLAPRHLQRLFLRILRRTPEFGEARAIAPAPVAKQEVPDFMQPDAAAHAVVPADAVAKPAVAMRDVALERA